jgi:hypothetical protein
VPRIRANRRRLVRPQPEQVDTQPPDLRIAQLAARQWGVVDVGELRAAGLSDDAIAARVAKGWLHPLHRGVYAVGHPNPPVEGRFLAAVKACAPRGVLSHFSAAALWSLAEWDDRLPEVTVPGSATRVHANLRAHRTRRLDRDEVVLLQGIPVTSPARTLLDLGAQLNERRLRRVVREAQALRLVRLDELAAALARHRHRPGVRAVARLVATGPAPTRSVLEDVVLDLIVRGGLEHPAVNQPLVLSGRTVVPDFRWEAPRLVVEADGAAWHDHKLAREDDAERQALLEAHGERVVRVTWDQAVTRSAETLARLRAAGAPAAR